MKKIILGSVLAVALTQTSHATTQTVCAAPSAAANGASVTADTTTFVKTAFTPKCSANVHLIGDDQGTYYGAGSVSSKGKNSFVGSTAGGGVKASVSCAAATGCTSAEAATAAAAAPSS